MALAADNILRCTVQNERAHIPISNMALMIEDPSAEIPEGYGAYLVSPEATFIDRRNFYVMPDGCLPGSFVYIDRDTETPAARLLVTADIPDRTLFTTGQCNSNCIMCPYTQRFRQLEKHERLDILYRYIDLMDSNAEYLCITGGEPTLLKKDFISLLAKVKAHFSNAMIHILTNGRTFYYDDFLKAYQEVRPYRTLLGIPLHASTAELHDQITQSKGSFYETWRGIDNLYMAGEHIEIRIVTSALNYENLPELAERIADRYPQMHHVCFMGLEMMGNSMINRKQVWCTYDRIWPSIRKASEILIAHGIPVQLYNYPLCMIEKKYHPLYRKSITPSKIEYFDACAACNRMNACGGFFRTTKIMPDIQVIPYTR